MMLREMLEEMTNKLISVSATPRLDAELLLTKTLGTDRGYLYAHSEQELTRKENKFLQIFLERRLTGEPIAYILGWQEFWSLKLQVTPDVLIPRPETELIVELVLQKMPQNKPLYIADLGTGSGSIALALAHERPNWSITAIDQSVAALRVARCNAERLGLLDINFICSDWCSALAENSYDVIIANPPYIAISDACWEKPEMHFEPRKALLAGADGLEAIRMIVIRAKSKLRNDGFLFLEHGSSQGNKVVNLYQENGYKNIFKYTDLAGLDRVTQGQV